MQKLSRFKWVEISALMLALAVGALAPGQNGLVAPPPQLGQPLPVNPQYPSGNHSDLIRSPLDPIGLDPLPPAIFPQPASPLDDLVRDANIYGAARANGCVFFTFDIGAVKPNLSMDLQFTVNNSNGLVAGGNVPIADLDWAVQPHLELGYRLGGGLGAFSAGWRMFACDGYGTTQAEGMLFDVKTRVNVQQGDFDYIAPMFQPLKHWDVHYRLGGRILNVYTDSTQQNGEFSLQESNNMFGGGPHAYFEASRRVIRIPGLATFSGLDTAVIVGNINQDFTYSANLRREQASGSNNQFKVISVPQLTFQSGLSYTPPKAPYTKISLGYQLEQWWNLGNVNGSSVTLSDMGFFLRGQIDF